MKDGLNETVKWGDKSLKEIKLWMEMEFLMKKSKMNDLRTLTQKIALQMSLEGF